MAANNTPSITLAVAGVKSFDYDVFVDDSLSWEVVDHSDDDSDNFSYDSSVDTNDDDADEVVLDVVVNVQMNEELIVAQPEVVVNNGDEINGGDYNDNDDDDDVYEDTDDDDDEDEYDLDDELVPKWVNNKFERQRMRKLGKRAFPKMKNSKRLSLFYNKPGCVHGKHGLGLKHSLM